jgi:predicted site-specific integrase-resolvase
MYPDKCPYLYRMQWVSAQQVREVIREVLGWEIHPNTLRKWVRAGKLRNYSPGGKRVFYPIEDVANLLRMEPSQVAAIVQKEKGGRS